MLEQNEVLLKEVEQLTRQQLSLEDTITELSRVNLTFRKKETELKAHIINLEDQ